MWALAKYLKFKLLHSSSIELKYITKLCIVHWMEDVGTCLCVFLNSYLESRSL